MTVHIIDIGAEAGWADLAGHPQAGLFSSAAWVRALGDTYGFVCQAVVREAAGRLVAALPFVRLSDIRGERIVCLPFSDYCDPLVTTLEDWQALVAPLLAARIPIAMRCLQQHLPLEDERFARTGQALWHGVDLHRPEADIWAGLRGTARQNVRKAARHGVSVRKGRSLVDVRVFHAMHCHVRKSKYRLLAQPLAFFENLHAAFAPAGEIVVLLAERDGLPIAGILLLRCGDTLYYKFNAATHPEFSPNDLLAWESLRLGQRLGLRRLDFGLSDPAQAGLVRYKRKFATEERPINLLRHQPASYADSRGEAVSQVLSRVTALLTEPSVPDPVTRAAGDELYRYFG